MSSKAQKIALATDLKTEILTCMRPAGADLDEAALCQSHNLSRTPVREVLRELESLGYVTLRENRGASVADLSPTKLRDFFLAAPMIYSAILRLAARNATSAQISALEAAQAAFCKGLAHGSAADRALANVRFHEITGEMAANAYLLPSFGRLLIDHARIGVTFYRPQSEAMVRNLALASDQHDLIIAAIRAADEDQAAALAIAHWDLSRGEIARFVMPQGLDGALGQDQISQPA